MNTPNTSPLTSLDSFMVEKYSPGPFIGGTANARGDHDGTSDPTTLFTVTGDVLVRVYGVCTTTIVGAGTIEVGVTGNTAELLAQVADATDIAAGDIWVDGTVDDVRAAAFGDVIATRLITNGSNIIETLGTANLTAGELYYVCLWRPVTSGSNVVAGS
jgi:hypothetical protein